VVAGQLLGLGRGESFHGPGASNWRVAKDMVVKGGGKVESWRIVWRNAAGPLMSDDELRALWRGLKDDDPALIRGATTSPPPLQCVEDWPVEAACAIGYAGWKGAGLLTVKEVEEYFARMCFEIDKKLVEPAGCRHFLNAFDEEPRETFFPALAEEIERELVRREGVARGQ
jgi:hypothetical protein